MSKGHNEQAEAGSIAEQAYHSGPNNGACPRPHRTCGQSQEQVGQARRETLGHRHPRAVSQ